MDFNKKNNILDILFDFILKTFSCVAMQNHKKLTSIFLGQFCSDMDNHSRNSVKVYLIPTKVRSTLFEP